MLYFIRTVIIKSTFFQLREDLDRGTLTTFDSEVSPHDVASLLKEYFRDLPEPLMCRSLYPAFVSTQSKFILEIIIMLLIWLTL